MMFVRVKDPSTGHEFDVPEHDWRLKAAMFTPVKADRYPPVARPRAPKFHVSLKRKAAVVAVESTKESTGD
jgi:hypothetical protein